MATDIRKAAVLLMSLPQDRVTMIRSQLAPDEVSIGIAKTVCLPEKRPAIQGFASGNPNALTERGV